MTAATGSRQAGDRSMTQSHKAGARPVFGAVTAALAIALLAMASPLAAQEGAAAGDGVGTPQDWLAGGAAGEPRPAPDADAHRARGVIEPLREAVLSSSIGARIVSLPVGDGERFGEGDLLVAFDCALEEARLAGAEAARSAAGHTLQSNRRLAALQSVGALDLALAQAQYAEAEAAVREARVRVGYCELTAPFSGRVVEALINRHETVAPGTELIAILDDQALRIALIVPSIWLDWLEPGQAFDFRVDETGAVVPARVTMIGARIDPASQSIRVHGELLVEPAAAPGGLLAGMSGTAEFPEPEG
jgi:RND family efflux transporter MFP subunit